MERAIAVAAAIAIALGVFAPVSAQSDVMVIEFTESPGTDVQVVRVVAFVGEVACAEARFDETSPPVIVLGTSGQPTACGVDGAEVSFLQFRQSLETSDSAVVPGELFDRTTFAAGTTYEFTNWAPPAPSDPGPADRLPLYMRAFVNAEIDLPPPTAGADLVPPMTIELVDPELAAPIDRMVLFVHETPCLSVALEPTPPRFVHLGTSDQPAGCGDSGVAVTALQILDGTQGFELETSTLFVTGGLYRWTNWAPQPSGISLPAYMQAYLDGDAVIPAANGNLGLAASGRAPVGAMLFLVGAVALLAGARWVTGGRPD